MEVSKMKEVRRVAVVLAICLLVVCQTVALAQNLGAAPQVNVAVQGETGAQPEGAFLNLVNWVGNVMAPVGAGIAVVGAIVSYASGRGCVRWIGTALGLLAVSGLTRLLEFWIAQGSAGA
jgi:flagellar biosynthesis protein FlhB